MPVRPSRQGPHDASSLLVFFHSYQTEHARKGKEAVFLFLFLFLFVAVLLHGAAGGARLAHWAGNRQLAAMRGTVLLALVMHASTLLYTYMYMWSLEACAGILWCI